MIIGIYKITSPSGRIYIGQSWNIKNRWKSYKKKSFTSKTKLYNSLKKYGWENHIFEIIHQFEENIIQEVLDYYEIFFIKYYKLSGYNLLNIRDGGSKGKHAEKTKELLKQQRTGYKFSKEVIEKLKETRKGSGNGMYGKKHSQETKDKISKIHKNKIVSKEARQKQIDGISKTILQLDYNKINIIKEWKSATEAGKALGFTGTIISHAIKSNYRAKGFYWKLKT